MFGTEHEQHHGTKVHRVNTHTHLPTRYLNTSSLTGLYGHRNHTAYLGREAQDGHLDLHTDSEMFEYRFERGGGGGGGGNVGGMGESETGRF